MADLTQVAANVHVDGDASECKFELVQYGEAITAGEPVYLLSTDSKYYAAQADTAAKAAAKAIAMTGGAADGYGFVVFSGPCDVGATLAVGTVYYVSATNGKICLESDLTTGNFVTKLGHAVTTSQLQVSINVTGIAKP